MGLVNRLVGHLRSSQTPKEVPVDPNNGGLFVVSKQWLTTAIETQTCLNPCAQGQEWTNVKLNKETLLLSELATTVLSRQLSHAITPSLQVSGAAAAMAAK